MEDRPLLPDESLRLIDRMIAATRHRVARNAGRPMLVWGYATLATLLAVSFAAGRIGQTSVRLWFALPVLGLTGMLLTRRRHMPAGEVRTFVDRVIGQVWLVTGSAATAISALAILCPGCIHVDFTILLMIGIGTAVTGRILRFAPVTAGGICGILCACALLLPLGAAFGRWLFAAGFVAMLILPGHLLNRMSNRENAADHE